MTDAAQHLDRLEEIARLRRERAAASDAAFWAQFRFEIDPGASDELNVRAALARFGIELREASAADENPRRVFAYGRPVGSDSGWIRGTLVSRLNDGEEVFFDIEAFQEMLARHAGWDLSYEALRALLRKVASEHR